MKITRLVIRDSRVEYKTEDGYIHLATNYASKDNIQAWKDVANEDGAEIVDKQTR